MKSLLKTIDRWKLAAALGVDDIEAWRDVATTRIDWPDAPERFYGDTAYLVGRITADFPKLDVAPIQRVHEAVSIWYVDRHAANLPPQSVLFSTLETAMMTITTVSDSVLAGSTPEPGAAAQPPEPGAAAQPPEPKTYLTSWREILVALGMIDNKEDKEKVRTLNDRYDGPIVPPTQGGQPKVEKLALIEWWNGLDAQWVAGGSRGRSAVATVQNQHDYGRGGTVVPGISGSVKRRRTDRKG